MTCGVFLIQNISRYIRIASADQRFGASYRPWGLVSCFVFVTGNVMSYHCIGGYVCRVLTQPLPWLSERVSCCTDRFSSFWTGEYTRRVICAKTARALMVL